MTRGAIALVDKLEAERKLSREELLALLQSAGETAEHLFARARAVRRAVYGDTVFMRGLIEMTNFCKNDCLYCGIRRSNGFAERYRLSKEQILECCAAGHGLGFRTFVLQGGEDAFFTDERVGDIVRAIKKNHPDSAVTLSLGEKSRESYQALFDAGADRYLLRHETANEGHFAQLHPPELTLRNRMRCLYDLKEIGYQVGCGFMVGSPHQTDENIADDLLFIKELNPQMAGIGPFIPHRSTPFAAKPAGAPELTLFLLGVLRLMLPGVLLPATTALGTADPYGREKGILAGANVVMPNLSPPSAREKYMLYDDKLSTGEEAAENCRALRERIESAGCRLVVDRGDYRDF